MYFIFLFCNHPCEERAWHKQRNAQFFLTQRKAKNYLYMIKCMICGIRKKLKMWITILILNHTLDTMNQVAQQQRHKSVTHYKGKNAKRISRPSAFPGYDSNTCYQNNKKYNNSYFLCNVNVTWFVKYAKLRRTFSTLYNISHS